MIIVLLLALIASVATAYIAYGKYEYWITNQRVVGSRGVIGYSIDSIPLEMIADVVVNRGIVDRLLNLSTLFIMPVGGSGMMYASRRGGGLGGTNYLQALPEQEAMRLQRLYLI